MVIACQTASAHDFEVENADGLTIYYRKVINTQGEEMLSVTFLGNYSREYSNYYAGDVVIPSSVVCEGKAYKVCSIDDYAFYNCTNLTSVTFPETITSIGVGAFEDCRGLTAAFFDDCVPEIGNYAFQNVGIEKFTAYCPAYAMAYFRSALLVNLKPQIKAHAEWEVYCPTKTIKVPEGIYAYIVTGLQGKDKIILRRVSLIHAKEGVLLRFAEVGKTYTTSSDSYSEPFSDNLLVGVTTQTQVTGSDGENNNYMFSITDGKPTFSLHTQPYSLPPYKAYLKIPSAFAPQLSTRLACQFENPLDDQMTETVDDITYDIVSIKVKSAAYDASKPPVFARVKYNKFAPLVITSDDMGIGELSYNWAYFNGYPCYNKNTTKNIVRGDNYLETPYIPMEWNHQTKELMRKDHLPLTYSDGTGGVRRFAATSAIWPYEVNSTNGTLIHRDDARTMLRTGWSFAQHDVDKAYTKDAQTIADRFKDLSDLWEEQVGIGLKVMVEPNGSHKYIDAGRVSDEICWNIFQNGKLPDYPEMKPVMIDDWTTGTDWTSFTHKPTTTAIRFFFQGKENEFIKMIEQADGNSIILGGTHGIGENFLEYLRNTLQPQDRFWVAGADEVWEYYHLYNNAHIANIRYQNDTLAFIVKVPRYKKHQFRELTINIPGIIDATDHAFSSNVITGGARQNDGSFTINIGLEDAIYCHIDELLSYYRAHQHNTYVKEDAEYLISRLVAGERKDDYLTRLNAAPAYGTYQVTADVNDSVLVAGAQDEAAPVTYAFRRFILSGTDLYEAQKNAVEPYYLTTFTPNGGIDLRSVAYAKVKENVVFFSEGEDLEDVAYNPVNTSNVNNKAQAEYFVNRWSSNGAGAMVSKRVNIVTLKPGRYAITAVAGSANNSAGSTTKYTFKLGENTIFAFDVDKKGMKDYVKEDIIVREEQILTLEAQNPNVTRWLDCLYIQKTGFYDETCPSVALTIPGDNYDATQQVPLVRIVVKATPNTQEATIVKTTLKDENGNIIAESEGDQCTYFFEPDRLGTYEFLGEATDDSDRTGVSDRSTVNITSDFTFVAKNNFGEELLTVSEKAQTQDMSITYLYPRYVLRGTDLYETVARNEAGQPRYGENLTLNFSQHDVERIVNYEKVKSYVHFYQEGEQLDGATKVTQDYGKGKTAEYYALMLGSNGAAGRFNYAEVTTLPKGSYRLFAGIGKTYFSNVGDIPFTFLLDGNEFYTFVAPSYPQIFDIMKEFEVTADESMLSITILNNGVKDWLDYIFIQEITEAELTGIDATASDKGRTTNALFNLSGQRVASPRKGIYLQNGRKVLVR